MRYAILEHYINLKPDDLEGKKKYLKDVEGIINSSYKNIGGPINIDSFDELLDPKYLWKLSRKNGNINAVCIYKVSNGGRKISLCGCDGTQEGKQSLYALLGEDVTQEARQTWGEFSGALEHIYKDKLGATVIPNYVAKEILNRLGKDVKGLNADGIHYTRTIGGKDVEKVMLGNVPKEDSLGNMFKQEELQEKMLVEAKEDRIKFTNWLKQEYEDTLANNLVDNFIKLKNGIKSPYNDFYYWMKNESQKAFSDYMDELMSKYAKKQQTKQSEKDGARLVYSDENWKVYEITTYEASAKYGKGTKWCISGSKRWSNGEHGSEYFDNYYNQKGVRFYYFINKDGNKWALAVYPNDSMCEIFNEEDVKVAFIPNAPVIDEIKVKYNDNSDWNILVNAIMSRQIEEQTILQLMEEVIYDNAIPYIEIFNNPNDFVSFLDENIPDGYLEHEAVANGDMSEDEYESLTGEEYDDDWGEDIPRIGLNDESDSLQYNSKKDLLNPDNFKDAKYWVCYDDGSGSGTEVYKAKDWVDLYQITNDLCVEDWDDDFGSVLANKLIDDIKERRVSKSALGNLGLSKEFLNGLGESLIKEDMYSDIENDLGSSDEPFKGPSYILPNGRFLKIRGGKQVISTKYGDREMAIHNDVQRYMQGRGYSKTNQGDYIDSIDLEERAIRVNTDYLEHYIVLPKERPNEAQFKSLIKWIDFFWGVSIQDLVLVSYYGPSETYFHGSVAEDIVDDIKDYYGRGMFFEGLSKGQEDFFKDSVIRDKDGNLLIMWHGTNVQFEEFGRPINWFSASKEYARQYAEWLGGKPRYYEAYLNCKKPLYCGSTDEPIYNLLPIKPYKFSNASLKLMKKLGLSEEQFRNLVELENEQAPDERDLDGYKKRLHVITRMPEFAEMVASLGYDSIVAIEDGNLCVGVFNPSDIKRVTNTAPTSSKNIDEGCKEAQRHGHFVDGLDEYFDNVEYTPDDGYRREEFPVYATDEAYRIKNMLQKGDKAYRIYYDESVGRFYMQDAFGNKTHYDMLELANDNGWIDEKSSLYDYLDTDLDGYMVFIPLNYDKKLKWHTRLGEDEYYDCRVYPFGVMFVRDSNAYGNPLFKALGKPEREIHLDDSYGVITLNKDNVTYDIDLDRLDYEPNNAITLDTSTLNSTKAKEGSNSDTDIFGNNSFSEVMKMLNRQGYAITKYDYDAYSIEFDCRGTHYVLIGPIEGVDNSWSLYNSESEELIYSDLDFNKNEDINKIAYLGMDDDELDDLDDLDLEEEIDGSAKGTFKFPNTPTMQRALKSLEQSGYKLEVVPLYTLVKDNNLLNNNELNYHVPLWGPNPDDYRLDKDEINGWLFSDAMSCVYKNGKYLLDNGKHRTRALYNSGYKNIEIPVLRESLEEKIVKKGNKWQVQSEKGKNLGTYDTKKEAEKRLQQVHYFKHVKETLKPVGLEDENLSDAGLIICDSPYQVNDFLSNEDFFKVNYYPNKKFYVLIDPWNATHFDVNKALKDNGWIDNIDEDFERMAYAQSSGDIFDDLSEYSPKDFDNMSYVESDDGSVLVCLDSPTLSDNELVKIFKQVSSRKGILSDMLEESFKHMKEDIDFDLSSDDFEEWCFDNMIRDIDSRNCSSYYIFPDGEVFGTPSTHDDTISEFFEDNNCDEDIYKYLQYLVTNQGVIRCTGEDYEHYVQLPSNGITQQQYETLTEWLDYYSTINEKVQIMVENINFNNKVYLYKENTVDDIIKKIKRLYATGVLVDSLQEDLQETDNEGNALSKEQVEFFKNSKVRDESGKLLVCYHGTDKGGFTSFNRSSGQEGRYGSYGIFFTSSRDVARTYTNTSHDVDDVLDTVVYDNASGSKTTQTKNSIYACYLNITNPLIVDCKGRKAFDCMVDINGDIYHHIDDICAYADENGYDGVIAKNIVDDMLYGKDTNRLSGTDYIVFNSNQIKSIDNKNPTNSDNINESLNEGKEDYQKKFDERTHAHIDRVNKYAKKIGKAYPHHDEDKFNELYDGYSLMSKNKEDITKEEQAMIDDATFKHVINNEHHCEHWVDPKDIEGFSRDNPTPHGCLDCSKMPDYALEEMCCDWCAMSEEFGNTPFEWYEKNKDTRWHFNEEQDRFILDTLHKLWDESLDGGLTESMHLIDKENKNCYYTHSAYDVSNFIYDRLVYGAMSVIRICYFVESGIYLLADGSKCIHEMLEEMAVEQGLVEEDELAERYLVYAKDNDDSDVIDYSDGKVLVYENFKVFDASHWQTFKETELYDVLSGYIKEYDYEEKDSGMPIKNGNATTSLKDESLDEDLNESKEQRKFFYKCSVNGEYFVSCDPNKIKEKKPKKVWILEWRNNKFMDMPRGKAAYINNAQGDLEAMKEYISLFPTMHVLESLDEELFNRGLDINKYVDDYIMDNLDELKKEELDGLRDSGLDEDELEQATKEIEEIDDAPSFRKYVCVDYIEKLVLEELQEKYESIFDDFYNHLKSINENKFEDMFDISYSESRSWSPGDFVSKYIEISYKTNDDYDSRTIRYCDGHDNGRNDSDLEVNFEKLMKHGIDCYDYEVTDLLEGLYDYFNESLNESKQDFERFKAWCNNDELYNKFMQLRPRLSNIKFDNGAKGDDIYMWMKKIPKELEDTLNDIESTPTKKEREKKAKEGAKLLYNKDGWKVYKIGTYEASAKYGKNTTWCISGESGYDGPEYYQGHEDITYFYIHGNEKFALIWKKGDNYWTIWNDLDEIVPYVPNAPKVEGLPDISQLPQELCQEIAKVLGINPSEIKDIWSASNNPELMELFFDYDTKRNYVVDTDTKMYFVIGRGSSYEDVTDEVMEYINSEY